MSKLYETIKTKYQEMQRTSDSDLEKRREIAYAKSYEIEDLEKQIIRLSLDDLKFSITLSDATQKRKEIADEKKDLILKLENTLIKNGFIKDYLKVWHNCDDCNDTGYISPLEKCHCYHKFILEERTKDSGLNDIHGSFENFDFNIFSDNKIGDNQSQREYMNKIKNSCESYANEFPCAKNLTIMGQKSGTGKTYLVESILDRVLNKGYVGKYYSATKLFNLFFKHRMGEAIDLDILMDLPLLVIDDLGTEVMTKNVTVEYFYNLISERGLRGHSTVVSSNLDIKAIATRYGDRIASRLFSRGSVNILFPEYCNDIRVNSK